MFIELTDYNTGAKFTVNIEYFIITAPKSQFLVDSKTGIPNVTMIAPAFAPQIGIEVKETYDEIVNCINNFQKGK